MHAYLFNERPLQHANGAIDSKNGCLTIYTVFIPEELIYFDALFFVKNDFQNPGVLYTQCAFVEAMPKKLDLQINQDTLAFFEQNKKVTGTKEADIPDILLEIIRRNAVDKKDPLQ